MLRRREVTGWQWLGGKEAWLLLWGPILLITAAHYVTGATHHWLHDIFRRLYYIPIVLGAFLFGLRGALIASIFASLVYAPHAFTSMFPHDPGHGVEKLLEILLYNTVALIAGFLADREYRERMRQEKTAEQLAETLAEMRQMEQQLIRSGKLQALGELTAGLAHEIKNPLGSMKGAADILADEIAPDSPRRKMLEILRKEIDRLHVLLERFLSFARPSAYDMAQIDLPMIVQKTIELVAAQARQGGVSLHYASPAEPVKAWGNDDKIAQVLLNLLLNAIQASPKGGTIKVSCSTTLQGRKQYAQLEVSDEGPGVAEEVKDSIFNPLFTTRQGGTGLGLSIALRIVDEHKGRLDFENRPDGGAIFRVLLPGVV